MSVLRHDERGATLVLTALAMVAMIALTSLAIDAGIWWMHKRHLQNQADAGALAGADVMLPACDNGRVSATAAQYAGIGSGGIIYNNPSDSGIKNASVTWELNKSLGPPCSTGIVDVTVHENNPPWYFRVPGMTSQPFAITAHAQVQLMQAQTTAGALPVAVPDVRPKSVRVWFINEATGTVLASTSLDPDGTTSSGLGAWDNTAHPVPVKFDTGDVRVGVVVALSGSTSLPVCGQPLVDCYDATTTPSGGGMPSQGLVFLRGWSAAGSGAQSSGAPILRDVRLTPGTCTDPWFSSMTNGCTTGVTATADFGSDPTLVGAQMTVNAGGKQYPMTYDTTAKQWTTATTIPVGPSAGPLPITIDWAETKGTLNGNTCSTSGGNKCKGTFDSGNPVQRAFSATTDRSGPIQGVQVLSCQATNAVGACTTGTVADSFQRCSSVQSSCTYQLVTNVLVKGSLANASSVNDPVVSLRVVGGSQNQSLDCDPNVSNLWQELAYGCGPTYTRNTGTACPDSTKTLWSSPQPWSCVALQTGTAMGQVAEGMNTRILGSTAPTSCTAPNHWSSFPNLNPADPRIVQLFVTPFGSFDGNGSGTVPVSDFATFYVTGWTSNGNGFANPCQGNGDDPVPGAGYIVGHFIKYTEPNTGGGSTPCDFAALGSCVAVMTQ